MYNLSDRSKLTIKSSDWEFDKESNPRDLEQLMIAIMFENRGIGLAANQIGLDKRVFVMGSEHLDDFVKPFILFNPKILEVSKETSIYKEGCLSFPGMELAVTRPKSILVSYFDSEEKEHTVELHGLSARCFQHEYDHLDGVCFIDKVSQLKLQLAMKKLRKYKK
jgi:peptide deformylase